MPKQFLYITLYMIFVALVFFAELQYAKYTPIIDDVSTKKSGATN